MNIFSIFTKNLPRKNILKHYNSYGNAKFDYFPKTVALNDTGAFYIPKFCVFKLFCQMNARLLQDYREWETPNSLSNGKRVKERSFFSS